MRVRVWMQQILGRTDERRARGRKQGRRRGCGERRSVTRTTPKVMALWVLADLVVINGAWRVRRVRVELCSRRRVGARRAIVVVGARRRQPRRLRRAGPQKIEREWHRRRRRCSMRVGGLLVRCAAAVVDCRLQFGIGRRV